MADEYKSVLTGGLSLKGGLFKKKKKKTKRKLGEINETGSPEESTRSVVDSTRGDASDGQDNNDDEKRGGAGTSEEIDASLTPAQRRFREKQLEREGKKIRTMVNKTHRERVEEFNALLASMTEHNDIPRCSAAGNG